ncbi:MAG: LamG domain-containing protein [Mesorhizobium sp.]|nr:MAG: LamG domain-containing protein [Mesorhizobium sp.]
MIDFGPPPKFWLPKPAIIRPAEPPLEAKRAAFPFAFPSPVRSAGTFPDPPFANVVLLLGFNGVDGATSTSDESLSAHAVTFNGNAQIDTGLAKFGASSCLFDGTGDYLSLADSSDWDLSDANSDLYTIEFYFYPVVTGSNMRVICQAPTTTNVGWYFNYGSQKMAFRHSFDGTSTNSVLVGNSINLNLNDWNYVAVTKNSAGKIRQWINGAFDGSATPADSSMFNSTGALEIGRAFGATANLNGSLDEIRITKGFCRYDTDGSIPVPTAAFPRS